MDSYLVLLQVGVYLATDCYQPCGALLPHLFTLTGTCVLRRLFSAALSIGSRLPGVTWHFALRSPDFPPSRYRSNETATVRSTLRGKEYGALTRSARACTEKSTLLYQRQTHCKSASATYRDQQQSHWPSKRLTNNRRLAHPSQAFRLHKTHPATVSTLNFDRAY